MAGPFDPYHKWLGIPPSEQPPHHYRLLGIPLFEDDVQVIEASVERQMAFLRKHQAGERAAEARQLLNEVSQARLCLLKPEKRAAYDAQLRLQFEQDDNSDDVFEDSEEDDADHTGKIQVNTAVQPRRSKWQQIAFIIGVNLAIFAVTVTAYFAFQPKPKAQPGKAQPEQVAATGTSNTGTAPTAPGDPFAESTAELKRVAEANAVMGKKPKKVASTQPKPTTERPGTSEKPNWVTLTDGDPEARPAPPPLPPGAVDILARIEIPRDRTRGDWLLTDGRLQMTRYDRNQATLSLPYQITPEYDLFLSVERLTPQGALVLGLPVDSTRTICALIDQPTRGQYLNGLTKVDNKLAQHNETTRHLPCSLPGGEVVNLKVEVRRETIRIRAGEQIVIDWKGSKERLRAHDDYVFRDPQSPLLASQSGRFAFTQVALVPITSSLSSKTSTPQLTGVSPLTESSTAMDDDPAGSLALGKVPVPPEEKLEEIRKTLRDLHKMEYSNAKKVDGKMALAKMLFQQVGELEDDPAAEYVMLTQTAEYASESGELDLAWKALRQLGDRFTVQPLPLMERAAKEASEFVKTPDEVAVLLEMYQTLVSAAIAADDMVTAERAVLASVTFARKPGYVIFKDQVADMGRYVTQIRVSFQNASSARDTLATTPDDPEANLVWGKHVCFVKDDWVTGLPLLARATDSPLAELAQRDVAQPLDADEIIKLGDDWWAVAEDEKEPAKTRIRAHATTHYTRALTRVSGLAKSALEKKATQIFGKTAVFQSSGDKSGVEVAPALLNPGVGFTIECWLSTTAPRGLLISKRHESSENTLAAGLYNGRLGIMDNGPYFLEDRAGGRLINDGRWHHVAMVKVGGKAAVFLDGQRIAQIDCRERIISRNPWKIGSGIGFESPAVKICRLRISNYPRYLMSFKPEYTYGKDKGTVFIPDVK